MFKILYFVFFFTLFLTANDSVDIKISGATTIQPIIQDLKQLYLEDTQKQIILSGGGSSYGIKSVLDNSSDLGMVSRYLTDIEKSALDFKLIGLDAIVIIVNINNPLKNITTKQLKSIYSGEINNWQNINSINDSIIVISKDYGRGSLTLFEDYTKLYSPFNPNNKDTDKLITKNAWEGQANNDILVWVGGITNAIGFISYGNAIEAIKNGMPIKIVDLDNIQPTHQSISNNSYPIARHLYMVYKKKQSKCNTFYRFYTF